MRANIGLAVIREVIVPIQESFVHGSMIHETVSSNLWFQTVPQYEK